MVSQSNIDEQDESQLLEENIELKSFYENKENNIDILLNKRKNNKFAKK